MSNDSLLTAEPASARPILGRLTVIVLFLMAAAIFVYFDVARLLSFDAIKTHRDWISPSDMRSRPFWYFTAYIIQTACSLPGATMMTLIGGFLFGSVWGTLYVNIGATTGATLAFLGARYLLHDWVEKKFGPHLAGFQAGFAKNAFSYLLTLRLIPLFPFFS